MTQSPIDAGRGSRCRRRPGSRRADGYRRTASRRRSSTVIEGKPRGHPARHHGAAGRGSPAHRGRPRRRQDDARQVPRSVDQLLGPADPVHARPACRATSSACRCSTRRLATSSSSPAASSPTSWSGDEINRASPKTQSAMLECMEERQVTVDGTTYELEPPFMVIATQNPVEMEGTYPLPEAQRDRFMARLAMGYPGEADEIEMIDTHSGAAAHRPARAPSPTRPTSPSWSTSSAASTSRRQ